MFQIAVLAEVLQAMDALLSGTLKGHGTAKFLS